MHAVYDEIADVLRRPRASATSTACSSTSASPRMQLDVRERGFAYAEDAPLDMRMDDTTGPTAADVLNTYPVEELTRILQEYGEERFARRIADRIVREREPGAVHRSGAARRAGPRRDPGGRPGAPAATRPSAPSRRCASRSTTSCRCCAGRCRPPIDAIGVGGRVVVMSYHSLEDRLTKQALRRRTPAATRRRTCRSCPRGTSRAAAGHPRRREGDPTPRSPTNPRAASVRLRAAERVREGAVA